MTAAASTAVESTAVAAAAVAAAAVASAASKCQLLAELRFLAVFFVKDIERA